MKSKWDQSGIKMELKWNLSGFKMGSRWKGDPSSQPEQNPSLSWAEDEQEVQAAGPELNW